jgi:hypothetical protein
MGRALSKTKAGEPTPGEALLDTAEIPATRRSRTRAEARGTGDRGFAVAGLHAKEPIGIAGMDSVNTSYPGFSAALGALARP